MNNPDPDQSDATRKPSFRKDSYYGALAFNMATFVLPALYGTLSKLWVANIDATMVVTTDVYTYINVFAEVLNEGLPRASWSVIGDATRRTLPERLILTHTLIFVQSLLGLVMSLVLLASAESFASGFVPYEVRDRSVTYVRISSFSALSSAIEAAVAAATRSLDEPDVPLLLNSVKFVVNIVLDLLLISTFRVGGYDPTVNTQAAIQLACNFAAAFAGLAYFLLRYTSRGKSGTEVRVNLRPSLPALRTLARPGLVTMGESCIRNALYLWLITTVTKLGNLYATAWAVFGTIRWGLIMVPTFALEATTLTFIGHNWGRWRQAAADVAESPRASLADIRTLLRPAKRSFILAFSFEASIILAMNFGGARRFARYLGGSDEVAAVAEHMWRTVDWCYLLYALSTQLNAILLATTPKWYLWQSLASNLLYVLPWAMVCQVAVLDANNAWRYHALVFGGSMVFSFVCVSVVLVFWTWVLMTGRARLKSL